MPGIRVYETETQMLWHCVSSLAIMMHDTARHAARHGAPHAARHTDRRGRNA